MQKINSLDCRALRQGMAALLMLTLSVAVNAYDFVLSGICYNVVNEVDLTCEVTYYSEIVSSNKEVYSGDMTIPETVRHDGKTYSVVGICDSTFYECTDLSKVTIGGNVTTIGKYAFYGCTGMTSVTIGNGVTNIGEYAFYGCAGLTSVTIGNGVTNIGEYAFYGCAGLTSVTIGNNVTNIEEYAFSGCAGLTEITIPESVTNIGANAFRNCTGMTILNFNAVACPAAGFWNYSVASSFYGCDNISTVNFGDKVTIIPAYICDEMKGLTEVTIPNSVTEIGEYAFWNCTGLTGELTIPNSVTEIGSEAFAYCSGLTHVTIGESVTEIGGCAFSGCI